MIRKIIIPQERAYVLELPEEFVGKEYDFQFFDAIIVAGALAANCTIIYSEDMHHNLLVEERLRILNPFIDPPQSQRVG